MPTRYNLIAGGSIERLAALSDGIFAVAMTLLVLDLKVPAPESLHTDGDLQRALVNLAPRMLIYMMSFTTLGIFWVGQQTQLNHMARSDRNLSWLHLVFLFLVTLTPFSTSLMAEFLALKTALLIYWGNILMLGLALLACWRYGLKAQLAKPEGVQIAPAVERRILIAQALYAVGAGLCLVSTTWSLAIILLVQLNYAIAPRLPFLSRL